MSDDDLLEPGEASDYLRRLGLPHSAATLAKLRCTGNGPAYFLIGRRIRYTRSRLREYVAGRTREMTSTSSVGSHSTARPED